MRYSHNKNNKHTENGLSIEKVMLHNSGFSLSLSIGTGVDGESTCIVVTDFNLYPDEDSRSERHNKREYIIPVDDTNDLIEIRNAIDKIMAKRNLTLING